MSQWARGGQKTLHFQISMSDQSTQQLALLLKEFGSPDNEVRQRAEKAYNDSRERDPNSVMLSLLAVVREHPEVDIRLQGATCIRGFFRKSDDRDSFSAETSKILQTSFFEILASETAEPVKKVMVTNTAELAGLTLGEWPELLPKIHAMVAANNDMQKAAGLDLLSEIVCLLPTEIESSTGAMVPLIQECLGSQNPAVRLAAVAVYAAIVAYCSRQNWAHYQALLPHVISNLQAGAASSDADAQDNLKEMLTVLCDTFEEHSGFFRPAIGPLLETLIGITNREELSEQHSLVMEILCTIVADKPKMCMDVAGFLDKLIETTVMLLTSVREQDDTWADDVEDEGHDELYESHEVGEYSIDKIVGGLEPEVVMPIVYRVASDFFMREDWACKFAALMAVSQTAEYIPEENKESILQKITEICLAGLQHPHPRVRFAACQCIGQTALDCTPVFQVNHCKEILSALITRMDDPVSRVQSHAAAAFVNFCEECMFADMEPFVEGFLNSFWTRFDLAWRPPKAASDDDVMWAAKARKVREQAITGTAVLAGLLEEKFVPYYSKVMPQMFLLAQSPDPKDRTTRGKALECATIIGVSVGKATFSADGATVMQILVQMQNEEREADDPVTEYLVEAIKRCVRAMEEHFLPFLPQVLPYWIRIVQTQPQELKEFKDVADMDEEVHIISSGTGSFFCLKTSEIEEIVAALGLVATIVEVLQENYDSFVCDTVNVLQNVLQYKVNEEVLTACLSVFVEILQVAVKLTGKNPTYFDLRKQVVGQACSTCLTHIREESDPAGMQDISMMSILVDGMARIIRAAGSHVLAKDDIVHLVSEVLGLLGDANKRRAANLKTVQEDPTLDEEDKEKLLEENDVEQQFRSSLLEIMGAIMHTDPDNYLEAAGVPTTEFLTQYLEPTRCTADQTLGFYVVDDILECLGDRAAPLFPLFLERMVLGISSEDVQLRQAVAYGVIHLVKIGQVPVSVIQQAANSLAQEISKPNARHRLHNTATDNCVAALGAILFHRPDAVQDNVVVLANGFLDSLPLKYDIIEAQRVHQSLMEKVEENHPLFSINGPNPEDNARMTAKLLNVFAPIYNGETSNDRLDKSISAFCKAVAFGQTPQGLTPKAVAGLRYVGKDLGLC
ncbi:MAG: uncharacterized protein KVP18_000265 [Porospora cf. gigantea A]|uniref:uncharacterized protein n=2 Tax=Porospora cf. gigantea A TaxID=2853593 RepID=UPI00355A3030|nr:MAG: hypothetical protein KVP18_000265 [Porospora cf. gigantea A]